MGKDKTPKQIKNNNVHSAEEWIERGDKFYIKGEYEKAIECYNEALKINPKDADAWYNKGVLYARLKKYEEAIECYDKALKINPEYANAWNNKGVVYAELKEYKKAIECYDEALKINPEHANAWNNKGVVYAELKKYKEAIECYNEALKINPEDAYALYNKSEIYYSMGIYDEVLESLKKIHNPGFLFDIYLLKGKIKIAQGKFKKALQELKKAQKLNPTDILPKLWLIYGKYLSLIFEETKAEKDQIKIEKGITLILLELERIKGNLKDEEDLITQRIYYWLGVLYFKLKDIISAKHMLEKSLSIKVNEKNLKKEEKDELLRLKEKANILLGYIWNFKIKPPWWRWWFKSPAPLSGKFKKFVGGLISFFSIIITAILFSHPLFNLPIKFVSELKFTWQIYAWLLTILLLFLLSPLLSRFKAGEIEAELTTPPSSPPLPTLSATMEPFLRKMEEMKGEK